MSSGGTRTGWEESVAAKYKLDPEQDRGFFDIIWAEGWNLETEYDAFDAHVESATRYYRRGQETPAAGAREMALPNDKPGTRSTPKKTITTSTNSIPHIQLDDANSVRQWALTEYMHATATLDRDVMSFRSEVLGRPHKTLTRSEALHRLEEAEIPQGRTPGVSVVLVTLPEGNFGRRFRVTADSVWGRLSRLAETLSRRYPWDEGQAAAFVLCGDTYSDDGSTTAFIPPVARVGTRELVNKGHPAHPYNRTVITMEVASWVPAEQVKEAYSKKQRELNNGKRPRPPSLRYIEVFRFVLRHSTIKTVNQAENLARLELPTWECLRKRWDETYSSGIWHYGEKGGWNFRRDFGIGQDNVLGTVAGGLLGIPGEPRTLAQQRERRREFVERHGIPESLKRRYGPNVKVRRLN
jgi:hypothetical protein